MKDITEISKPKILKNKILQFGQGNFLRGFFDYMVDVYNERYCGDFGIVIVKNTREGDMSLFSKQNNLYTVLVRGIVDHKLYTESRIIRSVQDSLSAYNDFDRFMDYAKDSDLRIIVSNTTEVGVICSPEDNLNDKPPVSFPAKLTQFLYNRYLAFKGDLTAGLIIVPTELINDNGQVLKECIFTTLERWKLPYDFRVWLENGCIFCSTLVDRIVSGYPAEGEEIYIELGYSDKLITACEPFSLFVVESHKDISAELPFADTNSSVVFTKDASPYRQRKLYLLNGAHTASVTAGFWAGYDTVYEMMQDITISDYIKKFIYSEVIPSVDLPKEDLELFAGSILERFMNPYLAHSLEGISTYSISKYTARILPNLKAYIRKYHTLPDCMVFSLAMIILFYKSISADELIGIRENGRKYFPKESEINTQLLLGISQDIDYVGSVMSNKALWGEDLTEYAGLKEVVTSDINAIRTLGVIPAMRILIDPAE